MKPVDFIVGAVIALVILFACIYIIKSKKSGKKCIGCPYSCNCDKESGGCGKTSSFKKHTDLK